MAPIKLKEVVTFSSQDDVHRVDNLLKSQSQWHRWICAPDDKSGCIQAELQLEKAEQIGFIDIGNYGSTMVEIRVKRSYSTDSDFQALLPATMFRTLQESRDNQNKNGVKMFSKDNFVEGVRDEKWDRVKVICREIYKRTSQFGLAFFRLRSLRDETLEMNSETKSPYIEQAEKQKSKKSPKNFIAIPAWKKDASFYRQYLDANLNGGKDNVQLGDKVMKILSTAEDGFQNKESFSRSAKMLLVASGSKTRPQPVTEYQPAAVSPIIPDDVQPGMLDFKKKLYNFLQAEGRGIETATLKELRSRFEQQLGYKMDKTLRNEFKTTTLKAANKLLSTPVFSSTSPNNKRKNRDKEVTPQSKQTKRDKTAKPRKILPFQKPVKRGKNKTIKKPPSKSRRNCPKCDESLPASKINAHILSCTNIPPIRNDVYPGTSYTQNTIPNHPVSLGSDVVPKKKRKQTWETNAKRQKSKKCTTSNSSRNNGLPVVDITNNRETVTRVTNHSEYHSSPTVVSGCLVSQFTNSNCDLVPCPICNEGYPVPVIEVHASMCGEW